MKKGHYLTVLIVCLVGFCCADDATTDNKPTTLTWAEKLKKDLLANYDRTLRPTQHYNVTNVDVKLTIVHVDIDEENSVMSVYGWIGMIWEDLRLSWDPQAYGNETTLIIPSYFLWDAELNMHSLTEESAGTTYVTASNVRISPNGTHRCTTRAHIKTFCEMNFRRWPFDTQHCSVILGRSAGREEDGVKLNTLPGELNQPLQDSSVWKVISISSEQYRPPVEVVSEKISGVQYGFMVQRKVKIFQSTIVVPAIVFILMTLATFWLPPSATEKVLLNCLNTGMICAFLLYFTIHLPLLATRTPLVVLFFSNSLYLTAFSLVMSVIVVNMSKSRHRKPLHPYIKCVVSFPAVRFFAWAGSDVKDWTDDKLKWDPAKYGNLEVFRTSPDSVWRPDVVLYNNARGSDNLHYGQTNILVYNTGKILWVPPTDYHGFCELNLRMWPFDHQTCILKIGSWTYDGYKLNLTSNNGYEIDILIPNNEWTIRKVTTDRHIRYYNCCAEPYVDIQYNVTMQRQSSTHKAIVISPAFVIMLLSLSVFWLPPQSGEKIFLNGIIILIVTVFLLYFAQQLPAMSGHTPLIVQFFSTTLYLVGISTILSIVVLRLTRTSRCHAVPSFLKKQLDGCLGSVLGVSHTGGGLTADEDKEAADGTTSSVMRSSKQLDWFRLAALIDRLAFVIYVVIFLFSIAYFAI